MDSAGNAALRDRRFTPVNAAELPALDVEVSVLSPPRPIASPEEFTVGEHGIILERDGRRAVYLPEVAPQQGWSREQTLTHLALKAGLPPDAWREGARLSVFTTQSRHLPAPAGPARATHASTGPGGEAAVRPPGP
jgi:AmmeMemoRadiSam system protein A